MEDLWHKQQIESLSDALQELMTDGDYEHAKQGLREAIQGWADYHEKELRKWIELGKVLGL